MIILFCSFSDGANFHFCSRSLILFDNSSHVLLLCHYAAQFAFLSQVAHSVWVLDLLSEEEGLHAVCQRWKEAGVSPRAGVSDIPTSHTPDPSRRCHRLILSVCRQ